VSARAAPPRLPPPAEPRLPPVQRQTLHNGLDVLIAERRDLPVADVRLIVRAGAAHDEPRLAGRAALTADLLHEGTTSRSAIEIAAQAELLGATLQTRATWDHAVAALHVLTPRLHHALDLLADVALRPAFDDGELERKRGERLAAILHELNDPAAIAANAFARTVYGVGHSYGSPVGGTRESVSAITGDDIRSFYRERYTPDGASLIVSGDVDADDLLPLLEHGFGGWAAARPGANSGTETGASQEPQSEPRRTEHAAAPHRAGRIHVVHRPGASQSELRIGLPGPPRSGADYFPLLVGNTVLGGAFTSRINILLRQVKGYTYGAGSSFAFRVGGGPFLASTAVHTAATAAAVGDVIREVAALGGAPIPAAELARAQNYLVLGLSRRLETTGDVADHLSEVVVHGLGLEYFDMYARRVREVTAAAVQSAAVRWLVPEELTVVIAGDADALGAELERLGMGAVHVCDHG
jgi:zinc protease